MRQDSTAAYRGRVARPGCGRVSLCAGLVVSKTGWMGSDSLDRSPGALRQLPIWCTHLSPNIPLTNCVHGCTLSGTSGHLFRPSIALAYHECSISAVDLRGVTVAQKEHS